MAARNTLNIHVTYGSLTSIMISTRNDFLKEVCKKYNLDENEIEIFDVKNKKIIGVKDLNDLIKVEIKKKTSYALNGRSYSSDPKEPDRKQLVQKLLDNRVLTGKDRAFLVDLLEGSCPPPLKRSKGDDSLCLKCRSRPEMKHRKLQVDVANQMELNSRTTYTQTDGLINYVPSLNNSTAEQDILIQSKKLATADKMDAAIATDLMAKSYDKRRNFILIERPCASLVREKYPLLFSKAEVLNELDRIFYDGKGGEFLKWIEKYAPHILSVARDDDPLLLSTQQKVAGFKTAPQKKYALEVGALLMISSLMQEDRSYLHLTDKQFDPGDFPYIQCQARLNDLYFDQHIFKIFVERIQLCEASDLKEAVLCLVACYFIFNIKYPEVNCSTLVTFEKLFLEANDTDENDIDLGVRQIIRSIQLKWKVRSNS